MPVSEFGRIVLTYPDEFEPAGEFLGIEDSQRTTSIAITNLPGPLADVMPGMTAERLASRGIRWLGQESVQVAGSSAVIIHAVQSASGLAFVKWILVLGHHSETSLITATVEQSVAPTRRETIQGILRSVDLKNSASSVAPERRPAVMIVDAPFGLAREFADQVIYTVGGQFPTSSEADPILVASKLSTPVSEQLQSEYAVGRVHETATVKQIRIRTQQQFSCKTWRGVELVADARSAATDKAIVIYQATLHSESSGLIVQGLVLAEEESEVLPIFSRAARSVCPSP